jgi:NAD(P)-dependent dehydrogenase (short-subunit alcohol dehydrogenase family)
LAAEALAQTAERCRALGAPVHAEAFDLRDGKRIISFVDAVAQALGGIDVLVNNAAVMPVARVEQQTDEEVDAILAVNLRAPILMSRAVTAHMRRRAGGSIIHISSVTGWQGHAGVVVYGTTKAALVGLARGQAVELGADGIRVNTVSPGTIDSPMLHRFLAEQTTDPAASRKAFDALHIRGICGSIEDVAFGCLFLASDESLNVTGSDLRCDGGYTVMATQPR